MQTLIFIFKRILFARNYFLSRLEIDFIFIPRTHEANKYIVFAQFFDPYEVTQR